ncbi:MAG: hypothetical protein MZV63_13485 [Marinilabiliales bacterium]|nr:hypothetical protein [Marinilabiliales bacterium]
MPPPEGHGLSRESGRLRPGGSAARQAGRIVRRRNLSRDQALGAGEWRNLLCPSAHGGHAPALAVLRGRVRGGSGLETGRHPLLRLWSREPQRGPRSGQPEAPGHRRRKEGLRSRHRRGQDRVLRGLTLLFDRRIGPEPDLLVEVPPPALGAGPRAALDEELAQSDQKEQRPEAENVLVRNGQALLIVDDPDVALVAGPGLAPVGLLDVLDDPLHRVELGLVLVDGRADLLLLVDGQGPFEDLVRGREPDRPVDLDEEGDERDADGQEHQDQALIPAGPRTRRGLPGASRASHSSCLASFRVGMGSSLSIFVGGRRARAQYFFLQGEVNARRLFPGPGPDEHPGDGRQAARLGDRQGRFPVVGPGVDVGALLDQQEDEVALALGRRHHERRHLTVLVEARIRPGCEEYPGDLEFIPLESLEEGRPAGRENVRVDIGAGGDELPDEPGVALEDGHEEAGPAFVVLDIDIRAVFKEQAHDLAAAPIDGRHDGGAAVLGLQVQTGPGLDQGLSAFERAGFAGEHQRRPSAHGPDIDVRAARDEPGYHLQESLERRPSGGAPTRHRSPRCRRGRLFR